MNALPLLLLGGAAVMIMAGKKKNGAAKNGVTTNGAVTNGAAKKNGQPEAYFGQVASRINMGVGQVHAVTLPKDKNSYWSLYQYTHREAAKDAGAAVWVDKVDLNGSTRFTIKSLNPGHIDLAFNYQEGSETESGYIDAGTYVVPVTVK